MIRLIRNTAAIISVVCIGTFPAKAHQAQPSHPDFSGRWVEESRPVPPLSQVGFCPHECTIFQTPEKLSVKSALGPSTIDLVRPTVTTDARFQVAVEQTVAASWQGATLVIMYKFKEKTSVATTVSADVRLTLKDGRLAITGTSIRPGSGDAPFEVIYRRVQ